MSKSVNAIIKIAFYLILATIVFILFYVQAHSSGFKTDTNSHVARIMPIIKGEYYLPHSMLHYLTFGIYSLCYWLSIKISLLNVMILLETFLVVLIVEIIYKILKFYLENKYSEPILLLIAVSLIFITSIYAPFFNKLLYLGQWSPNTWHNPTTFIIKPIAICCMFGIYLFIQEHKFTKNKIFIVLLSAIFTLSIWAKPSFAISFYPALFIFLLVFHAKKYKLYLNIFLILLPSVIFLVIQYLRTYYVQIENTTDLKDNIIFTFFGVTRLYTSNIFISLILAIAFPLSILIMDFKNVRKNHILILAWLNIIIAYLQSSFLAEKFKFNQAAFVFGYNLALFFLFIFSFIHFLDYIRVKSEKKEKIIGSILLIVFFLHLYSGVYYYFHFLLTKSYS